MNLKLTHRPQLAVHQAMRFSNVLKMSEQDIARLAALLEADPLFQKLCYSQDSELRVFSRTRFPSGRLSTSFYEIPREAREPLASEDVEGLVQGHKDLVEKMRWMGPEKYESYFLNEDQARTPLEIAKDLNLPLKTVCQVQKLTNQILMNPDFFSLRPASSGVPELRYTRLAEYTPNSQGEMEILFLSPSMARGTYKIDYDKIRKLKLSGALSDPEKKTLQKTVMMLEMINSRRNLVYRILTLIPKWQRDFFETSDWDRLKPLTQKSVAQELKVTPAAICRALQNRSVLPPNRQESPLTDFFPSAKDILKRKAAGLMRENKNKTDGEIRKILENKFGVRLSRRSVNVYRNEILTRRV